MAVLFAAATTNAAGTTTAQQGEGFMYRLFVWGTWDAATVVFQTSPDGTEFDAFDETQYTFSAAMDPIDIFIPKGIFYKTTTTGGNENTQSLSASLMKLYQNRV